MTVALLGVTSVGRYCKRLVGVGESAPAFVFFNIIFIWGVYIGLVRQERVRYCRHCKAYVKGFDRHCPAFGNCIGQKTHVLFIILLFGFVFTEASYVECSSQ
ncbi:unnamed protein product [Camellia sinensis]